VTPQPETKPTKIKVVQVATGEVAEMFVADRTFYRGQPYEVTRKELWTASQLRKDGMPDKRERPRSYGADMAFNGPRGYVEFSEASEGVANAIRAEIKALQGKLREAQEELVAHYQGSEVAK